jgi:hypothetical protein
MSHPISMRRFSLGDECVFSQVLPQVCEMKIEKVLGPVIAENKYSPVHAYYMDSGRHQVIYICTE